MIRRALVVASLLLLGSALADDAAKDPFAFSLEVKEKVLANGLRVVVAPRKGAPRVACALWFRVGSVDEEPGKTGLAHVLEHMMFKGTRRIGVKAAALGEKLIAQLDATWDSQKPLAAKVGEPRLHELRARERSLAAACGRLLGARADLAAVASEASFIASSFGAADEPYLVLRRVEQDFERLSLEERKNDIQEELWDTYVNAGGTGINAFTTEDTTQYIVTLPSNKLELFFWLEADRLAEPVFREWYPEREIVKEERRNDENQSDGPFYEALAATVFGPHPYWHQILGWMKDLDELGPQDAR
ncbi:MAG: M16 family metallopeptidase, partial [Planctomycetota bacterium]